MNQPTLLPSIINDPRYNGVIFKRMLHELIPRRTSIEIECVGRLADHITKETPISRSKGFFIHRLYPGIAKKYGILSFGIDDRFGCDYDEHNISITNYTQLSGLYKVLEDMKKYCSLNTASGCHIHVDMTKTYHLPAYSETKLRDFFNTKINNGTIDDTFGKYNSGMMDEKAIGHSKSCWITIRRNFNSLEFRTPPMTFDYSTIVKWFIAVNKWLTEFEYSLPSEYTEPRTERPTPKKRSLYQEFMGL